MSHLSAFEHNMQLIEDTSYVKQVPDPELRNSPGGARTGFRASCWGVGGAECDC